MSAPADTAAPVLPSFVMVKRHALVTRIAHWVNVLLMSLLLMSGLQILNAHPALYWGQQSDFAHPLASIASQETADGRLVGVTTVGTRAFDTTGFLGASYFDSEITDRAFPSWITLPGGQSLGLGRRWHFLAAWLFVVNGAIYLMWSFLRRHVQRDLWPMRSELRLIGSTLQHHLLLRFPRGKAARHYNVLQKLSYLSVVFGALPLMVLTGLGMSPRVNAQWPLLLTLLQGRQSARTLHFLVAASLLLFVFVHVAMVIATGFWNEFRSMVTGHYAITPERRKAGETGHE